MNRKLFSGLIIFIVIMFTGITILATMAIFSADFTMTNSKGKVISIGKTFIKGDKIRQETTLEGKTSITILRLDKNLSWTLMPESKQYMEMAFPFDPSHPPKETTTEYGYESKIIGNETVNGYECEVVQYTYKNKKYGVLIQWVAKKLNFAVKYQTQDSKGKIIMTMEYKNIKTGNIADSLFEIPGEYNKFSLPFKMPAIK